MYCYLLQLLPERPSSGAAAGVQQENTVPCEEEAGQWADE